ncbi:MAG: ATP-binding cassette domain-containing protein [Planctomycetota bacterium]|nr:ATP-binding cassette domain-containing protein [Planctomycetota bacterium]
MTSSLGEVLIEFRAISRSFGEQSVLRDVSFSVRRGETLVLIGESGCGKSVSLKLMMALMEPTSGRILWDGQDAWSLNEQERNRQRLRFGYLFQGAALFDSLNIFDNVAFGLRQNTDLPHSQIQDIVFERLQEVGLRKNVCRQKPAELSGGMKKRVGLARALAMSPDIMFYDEPTTGLDPIMTDVINELIVQTRVRRPVTSVVVTHEMRTVEKVADNVIMLYPLARLEPDESQVVFSGTRAEAFQSNNPRVSQFIRGEAGDRMDELSLQRKQTVRDSATPSAA